MPSSENWRQDVPVLKHHLDMAPRPEKVDREKNPACRLRGASSFGVSQYATKEFLAWPSTER